MGLVQKKRPEILSVKFCVNKGAAMEMKSIFLLTRELRETLILTLF